VVHKSFKPVAGCVIAFAMCLSSTAASAASLPTASAFAPTSINPASINPFVALSAYGTIQSQAAVCAAAGTAAATAANGQPAAGCVLPVVDPVAVVPVDAAPVALAPVGGGFGLGVGAILAGLIAVAGLAAVLLSSNGKGRLPVTPD
jgi:hypothetical protein